MQKIEKWRLTELSFLLLDIQKLLFKSNNSEWANVFHHFHLECQKLISKDKFDLEALKRLIRNIKNCYHGLNSFKDLPLKTGNPDLNQARARLFLLLDEMEERTVEYIH